jgi:hypothetical protein
MSIVVKYLTKEHTYLVQAIHSLASCYKTQHNRLETTRGFAILRRSPMPISIRLEPGLALPCSIRWRRDVEIARCIVPKSRGAVKILLEARVDHEEASDDGAVNNGTGEM